MRYHQVELSDQDLDLIVSALEIVQPEPEDMEKCRGLLIPFLRNLIETRRYQPLLDKWAKNSGKASAQRRAAGRVAKAKP